MSIIGNGSIAPFGMFGLQQPLPEDPRVKKAMQPGFFGAGGAGRGLAGIIGDALLSASGRNPIYTPHIMQQRQQQQEDERWEKRLGLKAALEAQQPPTPTSGEKYADALGLTGPERLKFIRSFAFKPTLLQVPNDKGGINYQEYDPSSMGDGGLPPDYDPNVWEVVE